MNQDKIFMGMCLDLARMARGRTSPNPMVGAVIVKKGKILATGYHHKAGAPHAEVEAIRDACRKLGTRDLSGATLYSAMEPCPMCCWAIREARIDRVVLGARHAGMRRVDYGAYSVEKLLAMTGASFELVTGVRVPECEAVRRRWKHWVEP